MKRIKILAIGLTMISASLVAQNEQDALRYSFLQIGGTARSYSLGGAFGALGGDLSSLSINPAGVAVFRQGELSFTPDFTSTRTNANFLSTQYDDSRYTMGLSHFGFVVPLKTGSSGIQSLNFGFSYNKLKDFGQNITMRGINTQNSLVDEFVYTANTNNDWDPFTDGLAWETWLIDYDSIAGAYYSDFDVSGYGQTQIRTIDTRGQVGEYALSAGAAFNDKLYIGATMGIQRVNYTETWEHTELDPDDVIDFFEGFSFNNQLKTTGRGVNLKVGFIARPFEFLRIGGSLHTPTFFNLSDDFTASMETDLADGQDTHTWDAFGEYNYELTTPFKAVGSVAFIYKNIGLISLDYEFVDYSQARLRSSDYNFFDENQAIDSRYGVANNIRLGAEYHMSNLYLRGGLALYQSPYVSAEVNAGKNLLMASGGIGYRTNNFYLDFGLVRSTWDQMYTLYYQTTADLSTTQTRFVTTMGFRF